MPSLHFKGTPFSLLSSFPFLFLFHSIVFSSILLFYFLFISLSSFLIISSESTTPGVPSMKMVLESQSIFASNYYNIYVPTDSLKVTFTKYDYDETLSSFFLLPFYVFFLFCSIFSKIALYFLILGYVFLFEIILGRIIF